MCRPNTDSRKVAVFAGFRQGTRVLLVCTACAEEGVDVPAWAFVVRFNEHCTELPKHGATLGRSRLY